MSNLLEAMKRNKLSAAALVATIGLAGCANTQTESVADHNVKETTTAQDEQNTEYEVEDIRQAKSMSDLLDDAYPRPDVTSDTVVGKIYFDFDSAFLDSEDTEQLDLIAAWMEKNPTRGLVVAGHADSQGPSHYNIHLARERADAARAYLVAVQGIDASRLVSVSHGEEHIQALGETPTTHQMNRRVTFKTDPADAYGINHSKVDMTKFASAQ